MPCIALIARKIRWWFPLLLWPGGLSAQACLVLSPANIDSAGAMSLTLSLYSSRRPAPAAVQWTFRYSSSTIQGLTVDDGPALTSAGKTAICDGDAAGYHCLALGANTNTIANGVIAKVVAVLAPGLTTAPIQIVDTLGASSEGYVLPISPRIIPDTGATISSDCRLHPLQRGAVR